MTLTNYHILVTKEDTESEPASGIKGGTICKQEILSLRVEEDPSRAIMKLLSADHPAPRAPRADRGGTHKKPAPDGTK